MSRTMSRPKPLPSLRIARIYGNVSRHAARLQSKEQLVEVQRQLSANLLRTALEPIKFTRHLRSSSCICLTPGCSVAGAHGSEMHQNETGGALLGLVRPYAANRSVPPRFPPTDTQMQPKSIVVPGRRYGAAVRLTG